MRFTWDEIVRSSVECPDIDGHPTRMVTGRLGMVIVIEEVLAHGAEMGLEAKELVPALFRAAPDAVIVQDRGNGPELYSFHAAAGSWTRS